MAFELPPGDPCLFCERIACSRDDWAVIEETPATISFVNPRQFEHGQSLVIPRRHVPTILDLSEDEGTALMSAVVRLSRAIVAAFTPDGLTVYQNNGVASFQEIPHTHFHVVPRRVGGGWGEGPPHIAALDRAAREERLARYAAPAADMQDAAGAIRAHL